MLEGLVVGGRQEAGEMQLLISLLVSAGTTIQMVVAVEDLRTAYRDAAGWMGAEVRWWRRPSLRRELRSWRDAETHRSIRYIKLVLASWVILFAAACASIVVAPTPWV